MLILSDWFRCNWLSLRSGGRAFACLLLLGLTATTLVHAQEGRGPVILVMGDSLSAGYGVDVGSTWVALLQRRLAQQGYGQRVVNASVSGETTGGARARLPRALQVHRPAIVILELGGNDGLRGLPLQQIRDNLDFLITQSKAAGAQVLLVGMRIPPNYGPPYADGFHKIYSELADKHDIAHVNFFLESVALDDSLMQADGIHPSAAAQPKLLENVWPTLRSVLEDEE